MDRKELGLTGKHTNTEGKHMARVFKISGRDAKKSGSWYGKVKDGGKWLRVKLFTDKTSSERRLNDLQRAADQRESGLEHPRWNSHHSPCRNTLPIISHPCVFKSPATIACGLPNGC